MAPSVTIARGPPAYIGLDYARLRAEALQFIERVASANWTDFNEHDPGVTTLEQLCYALTELSYRAGASVADLLADSDGVIDTRRQALHGPRRILPSQPLTPNDYRKLLVDRIPGVGNAWLTPYRPGGRAELAGLYDIALYAPALDSRACECAEDTEPLRTQALGVFARHRGLCEDVHRIVVLRPLRATLHAVAVIDGSESPERVTAELLHRAAIALAPELRRRPLSALRAEGRSPSTIFDGPLLRNGFIDSELEPKAERIRVADLVRVMAACPSVRTVNELTVRVDRAAYTPSDAAGIPVPADSVLRLDSGTEGRVLPIRLIRAGQLCRPDPTRVSHELSRLWRAYRQTHPLARDYQEAFATPRGTPADFAQYTSVQNQYPAVYGIGQTGLPANAPPLRRGQAKQLQGYLLVFEQILADYFAQLSHMRDLLSIDSALDRTYFGQSLVDSVPGAKDLLIDPSSVEPLRRQRDSVAERRSRFLDVLLALYAEELDDSCAASCIDEAGREQAAAALVQKNLGVLARIAATTRSRARGFDYLAAHSARNVSSLEDKSRIELGIEPAARQGQAAPAHGGGLYIVEHVLLRPARFLRAGSAALDGFEYGLILSAVICPPDGQTDDAAFHRHASAVLRRNAPAHLAVVARFVDTARLQDFCTLYTAWRQALAHREPWDIVRRCIGLRDFLAQCPPSAFDDDQRERW